MTRPSWLLGAAWSLFLFVMSGPVLADAPPPDLCNTVGAACRLPGGGAGVCVEATCSRPDYASRGGDGPMRFVDYPCNRCRPSGAVERAPAEHGSESPAAEEPEPAPPEPAPPEPAPAEPAPAEPAPAEAPRPAAAPPPAAAPDESSSFCAIQPGARDRVSLGLWLAAMAVWARRRRG